MFVDLPSGLGLFLIGAGAYGIYEYFKEPKVKSYPRAPQVTIKEDPVSSDSEKPETKAPSNAPCSYEPTSWRLTCEQKLEASSEWRAIPAIAKKIGATKYPTDILGSHVIYAVVRDLIDDPDINIRADNYFWYIFEGDGWRFIVDFIVKQKDIDYWIWNLPDDEMGFNEDLCDIKSDEFIDAFNYLFNDEEVLEDEDESTPALKPGVKAMVEELSYIRECYDSNALSQADYELFRQKSIHYVVEDYEKGELTADEYVEAMQIADNY